MKRLRSPDQNLQLFCLGSLPRWTSILRFHEQFRGFIAAVGILVNYSRRPWDLTGRLQFQRMFWTPSHQFGTEWNTAGAIRTNVNRFNLLRASIKVADKRVRKPCTDDKKYQIGRASCRE